MLSNVLLAYRDIAKNFKTLEWGFTFDFFVWKASKLFLKMYMNYFRHGMFSGVDYSPYH